jgi:hypothetical protein
MEGKKGAVEYFTAFLIGGIVLLIALATLFSFVDSQVAPRNQTISGKETFVPYNFAFDISKIREEKKFTLGDRTVSDGVLFGSEQIKYSIQENALDLRINFNVSGSNFYLPFIMKVNGNEVVNKPLFDGMYSFTLTNISSNKTDILIEMQTENSGWRLWAPSIYNLKDISFDVGRFSDVDKEFRFNVTDLGKLKRGRIDFTFEKNEGILSVVLNNNTVYKDAVNDIKTINLQKEHFVTGINRIILSADDNSKFIGRAVMAVVYGG